jgi:hypothetical protein
VCQLQAPLSHHLDKIPQTELVAQVPAYAQNDHVPTEATAREQPIHALQLHHRQLSIRSARHRNRLARVICTKALLAVSRRT